MKKLVIITHPHLDKSLVNKRWIDELNKYPEKYDVHDLYRAYPDEKIDVPQEQLRLAAYDTIILQFPFYWFTCPPLLKKWFDEVLTDGWAYGSKGDTYQLAGKKFVLGITAGNEAEDYSASGRYKCTMDQVTMPFKLTLEYIKADYKSHFVFYGAEHRPTAERIEKSAHDYRVFLDNL